MIFMNNQYELYKLLEPVFKVKKRINIYYSKDISDKEICKILSIKWKNTYDLCLSDIVNDILLFDGSGLDEKK